MTSFSSAQMRRADTSPPSWPAASRSGSVARARTVRREMPETSSSVRGRPNRYLSISVSQVRKRGQARVHSVQPFSPWVQLSGRPRRRRGRAGTRPRVVVAEHVVGAGDDTGGAAGAQARRDDFGEQLGPVRLLRWHGPTIFGLAGRVRLPSRRARDPGGRALPNVGRARPGAGTWPGCGWSTPATAVAAPRRDACATPSSAAASPRARRASCWSSTPTRVRPSASASA